jgi:hypothetical protein
MRLSRPRYTIFSLMVVVLVSSLTLAIFVVGRERLRRIAAHQRAMLRARAEFNNAALTRQVAETAVIEYTEGVFKEELKAIENEIAFAKAYTARSQERLAEVRRSGLKGKELNTIVAAAEDETCRAETRLDLAQEKKDVLVNETKKRTVSELADEVKKARASEAARKADYEKLNANRGSM